MPDARPAGHKGAESIDERRDNQHYRLSEESVREDLQRQPHLLMRLAENSLTVADSLRDNYFKNTARFVSSLRRSMHQAARDEHTDPLLEISDVSEISWSDVHDEVVTFIDGGVGQIEISAQVPILLRVGSYSVRTGERRLAEREQFGYYPVILGDLQGGSKERKDFVDVVRITAELLGGLSAMVRNPDLRVLMFHGPLTYLVGAYAGHTPFTEADVDVFLGQYAQSKELAQELKEQFLEEARLEIYPSVVPERSDELIRRTMFDPLCWMSFLYRRLVQEALNREPVPIIAGVVERGALSEFTRNVLLPRIFLGLRREENENYFNEMYGRTDLTSPKALLDRLGYTDTLLLAMLLAPGQASEPWSIDKFEGLRKGRATLPGEAFGTDFDWSPLKPPAQLGFTARITITADAWVDAKEVEHAFRDEQRQILGGDARPLPERTLEAVAFVARRMREHGREYWRESWEAWNRTCPKDWRYGSYRGFRQVFERFIHRPYNLPKYKLPERTPYQRWRDDWSFGSPKNTPAG